MMINSTPLIRSHASVDIHHGERVCAVLLLQVLIMCGYFSFRIDLHAAPVDHHGHASMIPVSIIKNDAYQELVKI